MRQKPIYRSLSKFIWQYVREAKALYFVIFIISLIWAVNATVWPYLLGIIIDILAQFDDKRQAAFQELALPAFMGLLLWVVIECCFRLQGILLAKASPKLERNIRMSMFEHVQRHSPSYFNRHFAGSLANKISDLSTQAPLILNDILALFLPTISAYLMGIFFYWKIDPFFALAFIFWLAITGLVLVLFSGRCARLEKAHGEVRSSLMGKVVDSLTNNFAVNLFFRFKTEWNYIDQFQKEEMRTNIASRMYVEYMRMGLGITTFFFGLVGMNGFMIYSWIQGRLSTGQAVQVFNTTWNIIEILWVSSTSIPGLFQAIGIAKQALMIMDDPPDIVDVEGAIPLVVTKGEIVFDKVSFYYDKMKLFTNKDVHIRGGEKVGLVGYSGAGKSSFVNLILRFYPINEGRILIDGQDIASITLESLRSQVALIPQDPILFHRSLMDNIRVGKKDASLEEALEASRLAHCDEFIRKLPKGYDSLVGERGTRLSGGERQRIAIARAMLSNAPILILDEATSSLDSVTEHYIQESLEKLMQTRTTLVIAHRLSTLAKMDRILVFDRGKIVEQGTHEELLSQTGHYAKMWRKQAGGFLPEKR